MTNQQKIPTIDANQMTQFHTRSNHWQPNISNVKHQYLHINKLDEVKDKEHFYHPPHRKTLHDFVYLKKGKSIRTKGLNTYEFGAGTIFFLPAHQITEHEMMSVDAEGYYCHFDEKIFDFLPKNYLSMQYPFFQLQSNPIVHLSENTQERVEFILSNIEQLYREETSSNKRLVSSYLMVLFETLRKETPSQSHKSKNAFFEITERYKHALSEHIYDYQSISDYANLLNISPNYLNKCVKFCTNKTSHDLLSEMLILEAKMLIKYSDLRIHEIAFKLCDQSPSNFSRFFKNQTGITPKDYAKICTENEWY
ncbi:MAG: AraC family transcriptional regulator [Crocinitomicaceae bacterium]|nr:AraC family transcriptional regulator [Crocinitomicaceae bacterium]|tara:strand:+ start:658 stop:1584 length:927 start_codon:yes stop_codon:yes gene_type:complete